MKYEYVLGLKQYWFLKADNTILLCIYVYHSLQEMNKPRGNGGLVAMMTLEVLSSPELLQRENFFGENWNVYLFIFRIHYLFNSVFLLFSEAQQCYVFRHCARLFVYLCISIISRSTEMLCFQALCTLQDRFISVVSFWNRHHNVLNKYKYCEQTLFCLFCYT